MFVLRMVVIWDCVGYAAIISLKCVIFDIERIISQPVLYKLRICVVDCSIVLIE